MIYLLIAPLIGIVIVALWYWRGERYLIRLLDRLWYE